MWSRTTINAEHAGRAEKQEHDLDRDGYAIVDTALALDEIETFRREIRSLTESERRRGGVRSSLCDLPVIRELAEHSAVRDAAAAVAGDRCFPVRAICFDKTQDSNWKAAWHQDVTIAVRERRNAAGFGPWSVKAGVLHVQPPVEILGRMVAVRLHLDSCGSENGPLRVIPGSHKAGRLTQEGINDWRGRGTEIVCDVALGGLLVMRPLILHASSKATSPAHRRVIHIEYAAESLPCGLQWFEERA